MAEVLPEHMRSDGGETVRTRDGRRPRKRRMGVLGSVISLGFIGYETKENMEEGDSFLVAGGKAALTNAAYAAIPGGLPVALGVTMLPEIPGMIDSMKTGMNDSSGKAQMFSKQFQDTELTDTLQEIGMARRDAARTEAVKALTSHSSSYSKYF